MNTNLKTILIAAGAVAVVASPSLAKTHERQHPAMSAVVPAEPYGPAQTVYAPDLRLPALPYQHGSLNPDFQLSHP